MRCLYCGNELALLKKLTGYGEFCSEAHRQKYQEQYNRLALTRLLQAQESEPERRPPLSRTPVRPSNTLNAGKPRRELDSGGAEESPPFPPAAPSPPPPVSAEPPGMRGFLPHSFQAVPSPAELFSSDPLVAPVTACLPESGGPDPISTAAANHVGPPATRPPLASKQAGNGRWALLGPRNPLDLSLERLAASLVGVEGAAPFEFSAEYENTIGQLTCLLTEEELAKVPAAEFIPEPNLTSASMQAGKNGSVNGRGSKAVLLLSEPDAGLFEPAAPAKPAANARPTVVINFAALGIIDPDFESEPESPLEVTPDIRDAVVEATPIEADRVVVEEPVLREAEPEPPCSPEPASATELLLKAESTEVVVPAPLEESPRVEESTEPVEAAPPAEKIPLLCTQPATLELRLADAVFTPLDDAQFDALVFEVQTPTVATCPLRAKVVFGPSPIASAPSDLETPANPEVSEPETIVPSEAEASLLPLINQPALLAAEAVEDSPPGVSEQPQGTAAPAPETPLFPEIEVLSPEENLKLKSRRRIAELTRKLGQRPPVVPERVSAAEPRTASQTAVAPPHATVKESPAAPPPDAEPTRRQPADLDALRREMERKVAPTYGAPPKSRRVAILVALVLAVLLLGYLLREAFAAKTDPIGALARVQMHGPALITGEGGWSLDWNGRDISRQVEVFRPSLTMSDYRFEFQGQIESKALGWMFRAVNPRNYYAMKLELIEVNGAPKASLSKTAVINGEETQKSQTILRTIVRPGVVFKVRADVFGSTFRTYVQDELVDTWIDDRLKIGGVGLLKDRDELADVRLIQLHELRIVN